MIPTVLAIVLCAFLLFVASAVIYITYKGYNKRVALTIPSIQWKPELDLLKPKRAYKKRKPKVQKKRRTRR